MTFQIKHDNFEGPLELLLELIGKEKLDISQISLARVADDYIRFVHSNPRIDPEQLADFLVVAAQLMLIKSRSLLPDLTLNQGEEESIEELSRRLEEYRRVQTLSKELKKLAEARKFIFTREQYFGREPVFFPPSQISGEILLDVFAKFMASLPKFEKLKEESLKRIISIEEKIRHIRLFLQEAAGRAFSEITQGAAEKIDVIMSFLAVLELSKQKFIDLKQEGLFAEILVKKISPQ